MSKKSKYQPESLNDFIGDGLMSLSQLGIAVDMALVTGKSAQELADIIKPMIKESVYLFQGASCLLNGSNRNGELLNLDSQDEE